MHESKNLFNDIQIVEKCWGGLINSFNNIANANVRGWPVDKNKLRRNEADRIVISPEEYEDKDVRKK